MFKNPFLLPTWFCTILNDYNQSILASHAIDIAPGRCDCEEQEWDIAIASCASIVWSQLKGIPKELAVKCSPNLHGRRLSSKARIICWGVCLAERFQIAKILTAQPILHCIVSRKYALDVRLFCQKRRLVTLLSPAFINTESILVNKDHHTK